MVLPPMLAQSSPSMYHAVIPSIVRRTGIRLTRCSGARDVQSSAGSVKWASQSMMRTSLRMSAVVGASLASVMNPPRSHAPAIQADYTHEFKEEVSAPVDDVVHPRWITRLAVLHVVLHVRTHQTFGLPCIVLLDRPRDRFVLLEHERAVLGREEHTRHPYRPD